MIEASQSKVGGGETKAGFHLEIAHVLFIDVVGYSQLLVDEQRGVIEQLNAIVRSSLQFQKSEATGKLMRIPAGDGMALVFFHSPEEPARCSLEIADAVRSQPRIRLRMGIHSGPVNQVRDVNDRWNVAGAGINIAERVMRCGDAGHILVTKRVAEDLAESGEWQPYLRDLGEIEVKHGVRIGIANLYRDGLGNSQSPLKVKEAEKRKKREGLFFGRRLFGSRKARPKSDRNLEEYDFYPFVINRENIPEFSLKDFRLGMHYFLRNEDRTAARQLIFIGEQNNVGPQLETAEQKTYAQLFDKYDGRRIADDTAEFLENYARIVRQIGQSFPNTGIEILLHNLANPTRSLTVLENNVTGRNLGAGATNLLIDLKRRHLFDEDKVNYELNIGSRKFKCTTIPIKRKDFGIVGAICINIDANYITEEVLKDRQRIETWFENFLRADMQLDENILSKDEYAKALKGKHHFKDESV